MDHRQPTPARWRRSLGLIVVLVTLIFIVVVKMSLEIASHHIVSTQKKKNAKGVTAATKTLHLPEPIKLVKDFWNIVNQSMHPLAMPTAAFSTCAHTWARQSTHCAPKYKWTHDRKFIFDAMGTEGGSQVTIMSPIVGNCLEEVFGGPKGGKVFNSLNSHKTVANTGGGGTWHCDFGTGEAAAVRPIINARTLLQRMAMVTIVCPVPNNMRSSFRKALNITLDLHYTPIGLKANTPPRATYPIVACLSATKHTYLQGSPAGKASVPPGPASGDDFSSSASDQPLHMDEHWSLNMTTSYEPDAHGSCPPNPAPALKPTKLAMCTMLSPKLVDGSWADTLVMEWIAYHQLVGVGHFYLYVDAHPMIDATRVWRALQPLVAAGVVTFVDWTLKYMLDLRKPTSGHNYHFNTWMYPGAEFPESLQHIGMWPQAMANHDCVLRARGAAEWVALADIDEFFVPMVTESIPAFLSTLDPAATCNVGVHFENFLRVNMPVLPASDWSVVKGECHNGTTLIGRYTHHEPTLKKCCKGAGKNIVNPRNVHAVMVHGVFCNDKAAVSVVSSPSSKNQSVQIAHYKAATGRTFGGGVRLAAASDWSVVRIGLRFLRLIGPS
eukprot:1191467-Prorocentrum_minimum.AAC.2